MADFSAAHPMGLGRRRLLQRTPYLPSAVGHSGEMESTVHLQAPADKMRDPRQSQTVRRRGPALGTSIAGSVLHPAQLARPADSTNLMQSTIGAGPGAAMAQTAVLGDSQGSVMPSSGAGGNVAESVIPEEDLAADGGVGSTLGESYVDGRRPRPTVSQSQQQEEEEEELEDGGVLGLLAQIYGTGANLKGRGRGPPRAI